MISGEVCAMGAMLPRERDVFCGPGLLSLVNGCRHDFPGATFAFNETDCKADGCEVVASQSVET